MSCRPVLLISMIIALSSAGLPVSAQDKQAASPAAAPATAPAGGPPVMLDLIQQHGYKAAWNSMFMGEFSLPKWIQSLEAVSGPAVEVTVDGKSYIVGQIAKETDPRNDRIIGAFSSDHKKCWGLGITVPHGLGQDGIAHPKKYAALQWYGNPKAPEKKALMGFLESDPSWK